MIIDVIERFEDFERLKGNWDVVYEADPEAQFFLSWTWLSQWLTLIDRRWVILAAKPSPDDAYVAFFPLRFRTKLRHGAGFHDEISMAGNSGADYTGFICLRGSQYQAIPALARFIKALNWTRINLENVRISDERLRLLLAHFPQRAFKIVKSDRVNKADNIDNCICPQVDLPGDWDGYLNSLSANTRQKIRRFLRMVENDRQFRITHSRTDTIERDIDILLGFWGARWGSRKRERLDTLVSGSRKLLLRCFQNGSLLLPILWRDDAPLGALAFFVDRQKASFLFYMGGRDEAVQTPPPGLVLHAYSIRHAIAGGFRTYDFLRGNEPYKYSLGGRDHRIHCLVVDTRTERGLGERLDPRSVPSVLRYASELHRRGNLAEAERGYRQLLAADPAHPGALEGLARLRSGEREHDAPPAGLELGSLQSP